MIENAVILSTSDDLATARTIDTNSAIVADRLTSAGIRVIAAVRIGSDPEILLWALREARALADFVIATGALAPGLAETVAKFLGARLVVNESVAQDLSRRFEAQGIQCTDTLLRPALLPEGAVAIPNPTGSIPGFQATMSSGKRLFWLPEGAEEMTAMLEQTVLPWLLGDTGAEIQKHTFKIYGLTESDLADRVRPVDLCGGRATIAIRPQYPDLSLRLTMRLPPSEQAVFAQLRDQIRNLIGAHVYAEDDLTMEEVVGRLFLRAKQTLALAESCTGGLISRRITRIAGSSAYYYGGAVTYSNEAKIKFLGVRAATLKQHGAVSRETALQMSQGIRTRTGADLGLSVTGIAGPAGGSAEKPVGTVWISLARQNTVEARCYNFHGDRERIILGASQAALNWLRITLMS